MGKVCRVIKQASAATQLRDWLRDMSEFEWTARRQTRRIEVCFQGTANLFDKETRHFLSKALPDTTFLVDILIGHLF
jgi:hypothetical protein